MEPNEYVAVWCEYDLELENCIFINEAVAEAWLEEYCEETCGYTYGELSKSGLINIEKAYVIKEV
jgi:hypothetical protein